MAISYVTQTEWISSTVGAVTNGDPIRIDGAAFDLQILLAPVNFAIQVSMDGVNWVNGTDADAVALTGLTAGSYRIARERAKYVRAQVAADAAGPQDCIWIIGIMKEVD
jgi:hypothetical protein